jgi:hypothetical protein
MTKILPIFFTLAMTIAPAIASAQEVGDRVLGKWSDGLWYPARITNRDAGLYYLQYDDGDRGTAGFREVRAINWGVGTRVECNWKKGGTYYPGRIAAKRGETITINYDDGDREVAQIGICRSR